MLSKIAFVVASALAIVAVAAPAGGDNGGISGSCSTGSVQCCNSVQDHNDFSRNYATNMMGASPSDLGGQFAALCTPSTIVGAGAGSDCLNEAVCCGGQGNTATALVLLNCTPMKV